MGNRELAVWWLGGNNSYRKNDFLKHIYLENVIQSHNKKHLIEEKFQFMLNTFFH